ncbi:MAG: gamma-glutamyltransferase [Nocardioidaceae bacterium]|nr:gamma-glutamyltransferase [Nocardioidaceae bacterium]
MLMSTRRLPVSVAAGNPVTAEVGAEILRDGGGAADAAVAMSLASCVAETVFTGLGGGGYAIYYDAETESTSCLDFFVAVPGLGGRRSLTPTEISIDFGGQLVQYAVGASTVAVPGVPAGLAALHERWGTKPWRDLVAPAMAHATAGVSFTPVHSKVLKTVAAALLINEGRSIYGYEETVLPGGGRLHHPGLDSALQVLADEGPEAYYTGRIAEAIVAAIGDGGDLSMADLAAYRVQETTPHTVVLGEHEVHARGDDLDDLLGTAAALELTDDPVEQAVRLVRALRAPAKRGDTTSLAVVDAQGNACSLTTSLGLSSGVWLPNLGLHLNSMLGEGELVRGTEIPGERMGSMMSPLVALDENGPALVAGAAGGSRIRSALLQVLVKVLGSGMTAQAAIEAPRLNPVPGRVHVEAGFDEGVLSRLAESDEVVQWSALDTYFGGVAAISRRGPGADPRRGGDVRRLDDSVS